MGKQGRKRRRKQHRQSYQKGGDGDDGKDVSSCRAEGSSSKWSNTIRRIRHGDPKVRHGALTALSFTVFSPESLAGRKTAASAELISAISERITDSDMACALCAAGCLANYVTFFCSVNDDGESHNPTVSDILSPVLLSRLSSSCDVIVSSHEKSTSESTYWTHKGALSDAQERETAEIAQQWSLVSLCLNALCGLVESCPQTLHRLSQTTGSAPPNPFLSILLRIFSVGCEFVSSRNDHELRHDEAACIVCTTRILHASLDENPTLVSLLLFNKGDPWNSIIPTLENGDMPALSRLHCAGILAICCRHLTSASSLNDQLLGNKVLPLLHHFLVYHPDTATALIDRLSDATLQRDVELQDAKLEEDVVKQVWKKSERARSIARRLEKRDRPPFTVTHNKSVAAAAAASNHKLNEEDGEDNETRYEKAVDAWTNFCRPLSLAVEVTANLVYQEIGNDELRDSDMQLHHKKRNAGKFADIVSSGVPDQVLTLLNSLLLFLHEKTQFPRVVKDDLCELVSKCSACLGNMSCHLLDWKVTPEECSAVWTELCRHARNTRCSMDDASLLPVILAALTSIMMVLLEHRPILIDRISEADMELILQLALFDNMTRDGVEVGKHSIAMLGVICSRPHSIAVHTRVCTTLLACLDTTEHVAIISEILNVLMDIYRDSDDVHAGVFEEQNVLMRCQKCVLVLKHKIQETTTILGVSDGDYEHVEMWKETASNVMRFIKYKQNQLVSSNNR